MRWPRTTDDAKRVMDVTLVLCGAPVWLPLLLTAAALVLVAHGRPVFFRQVRIGQERREFTVLKIRTMDTRPDENAREVTLLGHLLRRTGLDELPQLLNVLAGQMSLVGPRPVLPESISRYKELGRHRFDVRPGLTGLAQVKGRNRMLWSERARLDDEYVTNRSLGLDLTILLRTPPALLKAHLFEPNRNPTTWDDLSNDA